MFTLNIRNIVAVGKNGMKWMAGGSESQANKATTLADIMKLNSLELQKAELTKATSTGRTSMLNTIKELKGGTEMNKKWREAMITEINRLNTVTTTPVVPLAPAALAPASVVAGNQKLAATQINENEKIASVAYHDAAGKAIRVENNGKQVAVMDAVGATVGKTTKIDYKENDPINIEYKDGKLTEDAMKGLLSDLDGMSGVERTNRGVFRRIFFGGGEQKEIISEQQLKTTLAGYNTSELDAIYMRITRGGESLPWSAQRKTLGDGQSYQNSVWDFDHKDRAKITRFQEELIAQVDVVATTSEMILGPGARMGLEAVLTGQVGALEAAFENPQKVAAFKKMLETSDVLKREPKFLEKMTSTLLRIGILLPVAILTHGVIGGYIEQSKLDIKDGKLNRDGLNLTAKLSGKGIDSQASVAGSIDLAGARLEGNWNDPEVRMSNRLAFVIESNDKTAAIKQLTDRIRAESSTVAGEKVSEVTDKIFILSGAYENAQNKILQLSDSPSHNDALAQNTLTYLAKVEKAKGFQFKGVFAAATLGGWMLGISGVTVDTSATSDGVKVAAGAIEASALKPKELTDTQVDEYLHKLNITKDTDGGYTMDAQKINIPANKKIQWHFTRVLTDLTEDLTATYTLLATTAKSKPGDITTLERINTKAENAYIDGNSKAVAEFAKKIRRTDTRTTDLEHAISDGNYETATTILQTILKKSTDPTAKALSLELNRLSTPESKKAFFDIFLGKTTGSTESRKMGADLEANKDIKAQLTKYFDRLAAPFARQYGLTDTQVKNIFAAILPTIDNIHISTLGEKFKNGFTGLVAYNQKNAGTNLVRLDKVDHANAGIVGNPQRVTDGDDAIRTKIAGGLTQADIREYRTALGTVASGISDHDMKELVIHGKIPKSLENLGYTSSGPAKVSSYLSFEKYAQCFNLGFVIEPSIIPPGKKEPESIVASNLSTGSTVGKNEIGVGTAGIGVGWKKEEPKQEEPKPQEKPPVQPIPRTTPTEAQPVKNPYAAPAAPAAKSTVITTKVSSGSQAPTVK